MKNVILIAPPASGKGTISKRLVSELGYVHLSTGDMLRERAKEDKNLQELLKSGKLVSDELVFEILGAKLNKLGNTPCVLDGFPRTVNQAVMYDELLKNMDRDIGVVIYLDIDKEELKERVITRLVCPKCNASYSTRNEKLASKVDGICDNCNEELVRRGDDTEEVFEARYNEYMEKTEPLIDYYKARGVLFDIKDIDSNVVFEKCHKLVVTND